ncbi:2-keto-4-pentenoate hydratase [Pseudonocardia nigra]|uniref:2-keto-4-pentenoate hydratase n=1 Tax=Pseudonocardia nigra TaxID=1921578 RepID=UPI001C5FCDC6|nr:fumarylacetoacetate hydrolase family protein [Pseudonocardia nigra]
MIDDLAERLRAAQTDGTRLDRTEAAEFDIETGHGVQDAGRALRIAAGDRLAGRKVGVTSAAAQQAIGAEEPVAGYLMASTVVPAGAPFDCAGLVAPRVEVEVAFVLAAPLQGADLTPSDVLAATKHLALALEVVDSRWEGGPASVGALVADDVSAAGVILGAEADPAAPDLPGLRVTARIGDATVTGDAGNVLGDPARAVALLCADLHRRGERLEAGDLVLSGALVGPTPFAPGDTVVADFGALGTLEARFTAGDTAAR